MPIDNDVIVYSTEHGNLQAAAVCSAERLPPSHTATSLHTTYLERPRRQDGDADH